jgi:endonuclease YncB( thermonuclease family)
MDNYVRNCRVSRVIDGDTLELIIDLGFGIDGMKVIARLAGINCPETNGESKGDGIAATKATADWVESREDLVLVSVERKKRPAKDSFSRYLLFLLGMNDKGEQECLNQHLIVTGHAKDTGYSMMAHLWLNS